MRVGSVRAAFGILALTSALATSALGCVDPVPPSPRWRTTVEAVYDPFMEYAWPQPNWIKFTIRTCDPTEVLFQNSNTYPLHHAFASAEVPPFVGMSRQEYDAVTLHAVGQQAILGALLIDVPNQFDACEVGIQLVREDPYTRDEALQALNAVASSVTGAWAFYYFPSASQRAAAEAESAWFESQGYPVSSPARWARGNQVYSHGWAIGTLKYFSGVTIAGAWASGALGPGDILLTDEVPAEIPPVMGVLTLEPAVPSSHVAILAQTWRMPFAWLGIDDDAARAQALVGSRIILRLRPEEYASSSVKIVEVDPHVDATAVQELLAMKAPQPLDIEPIAPLGAWSASTDVLTPAAVPHFGGKASNFGYLRRSIPDDSPVAVAFSFDLWTTFLDQPLAGGRSLREEIATRLAPHAWPVADPTTLALDLAGVRNLFKDPLLTSFSPTLEAAVVATLQDPRHGFDPAQNIRFRSSTNVEDSEGYTGAGLYESFSGCLLDDLDADALGPSACDPTEADERGVVRAIRKVFASFYADNAYVDRLRHGVDESEVGMALLVHHSFPDAIERANGVMILDPSGRWEQVSFTTQAGAVSVTNPQPGLVPEIVEGTLSPPLVLYSMQGSTLLPIGEHVLRWRMDYDELHRLAGVVRDRMVLEGGNPSRRLEFEYKALEPDGRLEIKQVRPLPVDGIATAAPYLVNEPVTWCTEQRTDDVFATHRLKGRVSVETVSARLTPEVLADGFVSHVDHDYVDGCRSRSQSFDPRARAGYAHSTSAEWNDSLGSFSSWLQADVINPRRMELVLHGLPVAVQDDNPIVFLSDFTAAELRGQYLRPVALETAPGEYRPGEAATLQACPPTNPDFTYESRSAYKDGVQVETAFLWIDHSNEICVHCQTPLLEFVFTEIRGLTSFPIYLTAPEAQSYRTEGHDWGQRLLFEPALDPNVSEVVLDELDALGVRAISVLVYNGTQVSDIIELVGDEVWGAPRCAACGAGDLDGDGRCAGTGTDCDDLDPTRWALPGEVGSLRFASRDELAWSLVLDAGAADFTFDVLRAGDPMSLATAPTCLPAGTPAGTVRDSELPGAGAAFYYLVRAVNGCPGGLGSLGSDSLSRPRSAPACP